MTKLIKNGIYQLILDRNLNKIELANQLSVEKTVIDSWITGATKPNLIQLIKISKIYKVSTDFLLFSENRSPLEIHQLTKKDKDIVYYMLSKLNGTNYDIKKQKVDKPPMDIHDKIKYLRKDIIKLTQQQFGSKMDLSAETIKNLENGVSKPNTDQIVMICMLCNVSSDYLIFDNCPEQINLFSLSEDEYLFISQLIEILKKGEQMNEKVSI